MRALLDTNILFDLLCRRPFDEGGLWRLRAMKEFGDVDLWVSAKSYTDLFYVMRREIGSEKAQESLAETLSWLNVCSVEGEDIAAALAERWHDFEDCLVNVCAEKVRADYLVTRDAKGFRNSAVPHGSATEFMDFVFQKTNATYDVEGL